MISPSKWWQTIVISWSKIMAYRLDFLLQILAPALVFFFIKFQLWSSIYAHDQQASIGGYQLPEMLTYHMWALVVGLLAQGHNSFNLAQEIRLGKISSYLIYPFQFWEFHTAAFVSFQIRQLFAVALLIIALFFSKLLALPSITTIFMGLCYCFLVSLFWFALQYWAGLMAFWLDETWILRVMILILTSFLSGSIIPIDLFPQWAQLLLSYTPFPYMTFLPIQYLMERQHDLLLGVFVIIFWLLTFLLINHFIWRKGIKQYTAAGM